MIHTFIKCLEKMLKSAMKIILTYKSSFFGNRSALTARNKCWQEANKQIINIIFANIDFTSKVVMLMNLKLLPCKALKLSLKVLKFSSDSPPVGSLFVWFSVESVCLKFWRLKKWRIIKIIKQIFLGKYIKKNCYYLNLIFNPNDFE